MTILRRFSSSLLILLLLFAAHTSRAQDDSLAIAPGDTTIQIDAQVQYTAAYFDEAGTETDTTITWSLSDSSVAEVTTDGLLTGTAAGTTDITASVGDLSVSAAVAVEEDTTSEAAGEYTISIAPGDTTVTLGDSLQFTAEVHDTSGTEIDTTVTWSVEGSQIGTVDTTGLFTATAAGTGFVRAAFGDSTAQSAVIVQDTVSDTTDLHTITIVRDKPGGGPNGNGRQQVTTLQEGDSYKLKGFPHPLNYLNGGLLTFPKGSLTEDITLAIEVPGFADVQGQGVSFPDEIVSGVTFTVNPEDSTDAHYEFEKPVQVALVFKRGLLKNLGIEPADLHMYFYEEGENLEDEGISSTVVDSSANRIFADVAHFSNLVLAKEGSTTDIDETGAELPSRVELSANYPNPFNPTTTFRYSIDRAAGVEVAIYDVLGRKVRTLVDEQKAAGTYRVRFDASELTSGIYFYRIHAGDVVRTRKMMLVK
jgi:hypothetical protein